MRRLVVTLAGTVILAVAPASPVGAEILVDPGEENRLCVSDGWGELVCTYTTDDWAYVGGAGGACVQVNGLPRPAACANGADECVVVVLGANRILCD